jgi:hypothetical protein
MNTDLQRGIRWDYQARAIHINWSTWTKDFNSLAVFSRNLCLLYTSCGLFNWCWDGCLWQRGNSGLYSDCLCLYCNWLRPWSLWIWVGNILFDWIKWVNWRFSCLLRCLINGCYWKSNYSLWNCSFPSPISLGRSRSRLIWAACV